MERPKPDAPMSEWRDYIHPGVVSAFHDMPDAKAALKADNTSDNLILEVNGCDHVLMTRAQTPEWWRACGRIFQVRDTGGVKDGQA